MKLTWYIDVCWALAELGGEGHLGEVYPLVHRYRIARGAPIGNYKEWTRNSLTHTPMVEG